MSIQKTLITPIQQALRDFEIPAWLFYGFHDVDPIATQILRFQPQSFATRRWFYLIPAQGKPKKLVHQIESTILDHLPGEKDIYLKWQQLQSSVKKILGNHITVAMQYSEKNAIPYISRVDAGTVELVHSCGTKIISSGDLIQRFESVWSPPQIEQHRTTALKLTSIVQSAFHNVASEVSSHGELSELAVQSFILEEFEKADLITDHPPIVAVNQNSANPHYVCTEEHHSSIHAGDFLLIDLWAKSIQEKSVYADITWTAFLGYQPPKMIGEVFSIVRKARDRGVDFLNKRFQSGTITQGWEVDDAVREVIHQAGYGKHFFHRTGHNLGQDVHGNGVHFDNLETHDTRQVIPGIACTIEPGIYLSGEFGVRSEINICLSDKGPEVTTPPQEEILLLPFT